MARVKIQLKLDAGWQKMASAMDPKRFKANMDANMNKATQFNGLLILQAIRQRVKARKYAKNAALTILIKKSSVPLIDDADLWGAVTTKNINAYTLFVGVLRTTMGPDGKPLTSLVEFLHEGGSIQVTDKMRNMFILLSEVGQGKRDIATLEGRTAEIAKALGSRISQIKPLKAGTTAIVVPPRPFIGDVINDPSIKQKCTNNWIKAAKAAVHDQAQGSSSKPAPAPESGATTPGKGSSPSSGGGKTKSPADRSEAARRGWATRRSRAGTDKG